MSLKEYVCYLIDQDKALKFVKELVMKRAERLLEISAKTTFLLS